MRFINYLRNRFRRKTPEEIAEQIQKETKSNMLACEYLRRIKECPRPSFLDIIEKEVEREKHLTMKDLKKVNAAIYDKNSLLWGGWG